MSDTLTKVKTLVGARSYAISRHAYLEAANDAILPLDVVSSIQTALVVEDYPEDLRGPSVLARCLLPDGRFIHALWGLGTVKPVLITVYVPDKALWSVDLLTRLGK